MKLKFYLRGLGIGILVTWVIMSVVNHNKVEAVKEQVRAAYERQEVDWVFAGDETSTDAETESLSDEASLPESLSQEPVIVRENEGDETSTEESQSANDDENIDLEVNDNDSENDVQDTNSGKDNTDSAKDVDNDDLGEVNDADAAGDEQDEAVVIVGSEDDKDSIEIVVAAGDDSGTVSRKLYNAGIVDSASEFDAYLMQHGYDKRINKGTKVIYEDDSWQEIAEKLTAME